MAVPFTDGTGNSAEQGISTEVYLQEIRKQLDDSPVRAANSRNSRNIDSGIILYLITMSVHAQPTVIFLLTCTSHYSGIRAPSLSWLHVSPGVIFLHGVRKCKS